MTKAWAQTLRGVEAGACTPIWPQPQMQTLASVQLTHTNP